jgi:TRAP-type mannitol/chloroaromatic compound transport system permease small subunit
MLTYISIVDRFSTAIGKAFGWYILILTFGVSYEVFVRYVLRDPTIWAYDLSYNMYAGLFVMAGAYALARNAHVRADTVYRLWSPRKKATMDLILFVIFFLPGVLALTYSGYEYAAESWRYHEVSVYSPADIPIFPLKTLIPCAGVTLLVQGIAEAFRCIICIRTGEWPARLQDVEEMESAIQHEREYQAEHQEEVAGGEMRS